MPVSELMQCLLLFLLQVLGLDNIRPGRDEQDVFKDLKNIFDDNATSLYRVQDKIQKGEVIVADWNRTEPPDNMSYADERGFFTENVTVENITCSSSSDPLKIASPLKTAFVEINSTGDPNFLWGRAMECEEGPRLAGQAKKSQPAIILTKDTTGETYVIVEERAIKLSFLYSVWNTSDPSSGNLTHSFHISSTVRLAEAVVTGIVNESQEGRAADGKSCFRLLRAYSMNIDDEFEHGDEQKASPFGENPQIRRVDNLEDVESIEAGVDVKKLAMICFVLIVALSLTGIAWSFCLRSSIPIDVYDRYGTRLSP